MSEHLREKVELHCTIGEISGDVGTMVPVDADRLERIKAKDKDPQFVTIMVEEGKSKNKRNWTAKMIESIAEQVRTKQPCGYKGHVEESKRGFHMPDPQTLWLNATTMLGGNGKTRMMAKGYNLPKADVRDWVDIGAVDSVSIYGDADMVSSKDGWDVKEFVLESIDWSRKNAEGMTGKVVAVTAEMDEGRKDEVKPEDIAVLTESDLRQHNPNLALTVEKAGEEKAKEITSATVGEMEKKVKDAEEDSKVVTDVEALLKDIEGDSIFAKIQTLLAEASKGVKEQVEAHITKLLETKVPNEAMRPVVRRLLVGEMNSTEEAEAAVNKLLDEDEQIKTLVVAEMNEGDRHRGPAFVKHQGEGRGERKDSPNIERVTVQHP